MAQGFGMQLLQLASTQQLGLHRLIHSPLVSQKGLAALLDLSLLVIQKQSTKCVDLEKCSVERCGRLAFLAGAAIYAIDNHLERLQIDHAHAKQLAQGLNSIDGVVCDTNNTDTNLVFFDIDKRLGDGTFFMPKIIRERCLSRSSRFTANPIRNTLKCFS